MTEKDILDKLFYFKDRKNARTKMIKQYTNKPIICFSCGNAARSLEKEGLTVLHIGEQGVLNPNKWFTVQEIQHYFPEYFDATSGHLNMELMNLIAEEYKKELKQLPNTIYLPTGSGETLVCLKLAFPETKIIAVYNLGKETEYNENAPLNKLVEILSEKIIIL